VGLVYLDNKILKEEEVGILLSEGFLYGYGLFETMRSYRGNIFGLDAHIQRLIDSCALIDLEPPDKKFLMEKTEELLKETKILNAYIRINLWKEKENSKFCIIVREFKSYPEKIYERGFRCIISKFRQNEYSLLSKIKSLNYLNNRLALKEAKAKDADEAILLNTKGYICEGSRTNLFLIKDNQLLTPSLDCGCLKGIIRNTVIDIAKREGIEVIEGKLLPKDLYQASEAFLTNSLIEIMPLTYLDEKPINRGSPGKITRFLLRKYRKLTLE
jgi:branched-subunit amino acid aminotransferase/4-amino-4-deoxychorismate lyase